MLEMKDEGVLKDCMQVYRNCDGGLEEDGGGKSWSSICGLIRHGEVIRMCSEALKHQRLHTHFVIFKLESLRYFKSNFTEASFYQKDRKIGLTKPD